MGDVDRGTYLADEFINHGHLVQQVGFGQVCRPRYHSSC